MVVLNFGLVAGGLLALVGAIICFYWFLFWERNFQGKLLTGGPYAVVRHPFYTGFIMFTLGLTIAYPIFETRLLAVLSLAVMITYVPREEEQLINQYKDEYRKYMTRVKWKLIPYLY